MAKYSYFVVARNHETGEWFTDQDTCSLRFNEGATFDSETNEWGTSGDMGCDLEDAQSMADLQQRLKNPAKWAIYNTNWRTSGELLFWSNSDGWVALETATVFSNEEKGKVNLPVAGYWIALPILPN